MSQDSNERGGEVGIPANANLNMHQREKINELLVRWNVVQGRLKQAEQISQFAVVPAINELRYAGRILVAALSNVEPNTENGLPSVDDAIVIASQYLTNAEHDISDALIYFFQEKADDLNHRYGAGSIREIHPQYGDFLQSLAEARRLIVASRADLSVRRENYTTLIEVTKNASDLYFELIDAEVLFGLGVEHFKARIKMWKSFFVIAIMLAVAAALTALASSNWIDLPQL